MLDSELPPWCTTTLAGGQFSEEATGTAGLFPAFAWPDDGLEGLDASFAAEVLGVSVHATVFFFLFRCARFALAFDCAVPELEDSPGVDGLTSAGA